MIAFPCIEFDLRTNVDPKNFGDPIKKIKGGELDHPCSLIRTVCLPSFFLKKIGKKRVIGKNLRSWSLEEALSQQREDLSPASSVQGRRREQVPLFEGVGASSFQVYVAQMVGQRTRAQWHCTSLSVLAMHVHVLATVLAGGIPNLVVYSHCCRYHLVTNMPSLPRSGSTPPWSFRPVLSLMFGLRSPKANPSSPSIRCTTMKVRRSRQTELDIFSEPPLPGGNDLNRL